jgi:hypothetical protein
MNIQAKTIPHSEHRYETVGDYWTDENGVTQFRVSEMGDEDYAFLVFVHELIEEHLTRRAGIDEPKIKAFDEMFEKERDKGKHADSDEPGFDSRSPYQREHTIATGIEMMLAGEMGINWNEYNKTVMSL